MASIINLSTVGVPNVKYGVLQHVYMALVMYLQRFFDIYYSYVIAACLWYGYLFYCVGGRMLCICGYDDVRVCFAFWNLFELVK